MKKSFIVLIVLMFISVVKAGVLINDCESSSDLAVSGGMLIIDNNYNSSYAYLATAGYNGKNCLMLNSNGFANVAKWDCPNIEVTTSNTLSFYVCSYWNATFNPPDYTLDIWYKGDLAPVILDGPRAFNYASWTPITFNMPKAGVVTSIEWKWNSRYRRIYLDDISLTTASSYPAQPAIQTTYTLPQNAIRVSNSTDLLNALAQTTAQDIILTNGVYDNVTPITFRVPHRIWSEHLGGAVLKCGLTFGGNWGTPGAEIHGLRFMIENSAHAENCIATWGTGSQLKITDCWFDGGGNSQAAIKAQAVNGLSIKRVEIKNFLSWGIFASDYPTQQDPAIPIIIEDVIVRNISRQPSGNSNGTAEAGIWIGNTANVSRVRIQHCGWTCIWTGSACNDSVFSDLQMDHSLVAGIYIENVTRRSVFKKFVIGPNIKTGVNSEWNNDDPAKGGDSNQIQEGLIDSTRVGVCFDAGTKNSTVSSVTFRNSSKAGIGMYLSPTCSYSGCIFDLPSGVPNVRYDNWSAW